MTPAAAPVSPFRKCTGHPNVIQLIEVFLTPHYLAIVLEYAPGGDLLDFVTTKACEGGGGAAAADRCRGRGGIQPDCVSSTLPGSCC